MDKAASTRLSRTERKTQILQSAISVFIKKGYNGTTTVDLAQAANISEVTLFRYFSSKKEIFHQCIEPILMNTLQASLQSSEDLNPKERLRRLIIDRIDLINQNHEVIRLVLMENQVNPELKEWNFIEKITQLFIKEIQTMGLTPNHSEYLLRMIMGSILSFLYLPEKKSDKREDYINFFLASLEMQDMKQGDSNIE